MIQHHRIQGVRCFLILGLSAGLLLAAAGCSDDDGGSSGGGSGSGGASAGAGGTAGEGSGGTAGSGGSTGPSLDEFGTRLIGAICASQKSCLGEGAFGLADCEAQVGAQFREASLPTLQAAVDKGEATYSGEGADACVAGVQALGCSLQVTRITDVEACKNLLVGKTEVGGDCTDDVACAPGSYCKVSGACPGKCTARESEGAACGADDDCQSGLVCDKQVCAKPVASGAACSDKTPTCVAGTLCLGASPDGTTPGSCRPFSEVFKGASGAACDPNTFTLCQPELSCQLGAGSKFSCVARSASGAPCKLAIPDSCPDGNYCDGIDLQAQPPKLEGTCKALPGEGQPCARSFSGNGCSSGLRCLDDSCKAPAKNGSSCKQNQDCLSNRCIDGTCVARTACNGQ